MRKDIEGFENLYQIDDLGNVYSLIQNRSRRKGLIKPYVNVGGYLRVNLYDSNGKLHKYYVHRLVAKTFLENPLNYKIVNHIDGDKTNNSIVNLEWCSQKQNIDHSWKTGLQHGCGENHGMAKLTQDQVDQIRKEYVYGDRQFGTVGLAKKYGVYQGTIWFIVNNVHWKKVIKCPESN